MVDVKQINNRITVGSEAMDTELTTLCYIEKNNAYLMLHRTKKENDINHDKYIGVGGHLEVGETPEECIKREVFEETGLTLKNLKLRGLLTFVIDNFNELAWLYTSDDFTGEIIECDEGKLEWISKDKIFQLPLWEGDKIFLKMLQEEKEYFSLKLIYKNDKLINVEIQEC